MPCSTQFKQTIVRGIKRYPAVKADSAALQGIL